MPSQEKYNRNTLVLLGLAGCSALCSAAVVIGAALLLLLSLRPETQTSGAIPQPAAAITSQNIDRVQELYRIPQPTYVYDVAWSPDGLILAAASVAAGNELGSVVLWDAISGQKLRVFDQIDITRLAFSPDGKMLAAIGDAGVIVWSLADGQELSSMPLSSIGVRSLSFSPDSRMLAYSFRSALTLLEMPSGQVLDTIQLPSDIRGFDFFPDGKSLITAIEDERDNMVSSFTIWDIGSGQELRTFTQPGGVNELVVAPDGKTLAAGISSSALRVWELDSGRQLQLFTGFRFGVPLFAFSPDGSVLAVGEGVGFEVASPGGLRLFDVSAGREAPMLPGHEGVIFGVAFSPDGRLLATASEDKTLRLWGVPPGPGD